jgi:piezo-type mechanosensitive ion channel component 1/2
VIALIFHCFVMFVERFIYLEVTSKDDSESNIKSLKYKFWFHLTITFLVHALVFWYFPISANQLKVDSVSCSVSQMYNPLKCNNFQINLALMFFYIIYAAYLILSALQIKYGSPKSRAGEFVLMNSYHPVSNIVFLIYRGMPFLYEIRTLVDWTFTSTALNLMQWFKFEEIYASLYNTKCDQLEFAAHPRGSKMKRCEKLFKGCCFLLGILLCLLAPLIIFSSLNPIVYTNPVKELTVSIGLRSGDSNFYDLSTISLIQSRSHVTYSEWQKQRFTDVDELSTNDREQMEHFTLRNFSDTNWLASTNVVENLCTELIDDASTIYLQAQYAFSREFPSSQPDIYTKQSSVLNETDCSLIYNILCNNSATVFTKSAVFSNTFRLLSAGTSLVPIIISSSILDSDIFLHFSNNANGQIWTVGRTETQGLDLYIISEKYSPVTFSFSVITFYVSVVYLIGKVLRIIISGGANNIPLVDMPNPDPFINVCAGIYLSRMRGDLQIEEELYYELIDVLRSPELMKMISGSSSIKNKDE